MSALPPTMKAMAASTRDTPPLSRFTLHLIWVAGCFLLSVLPHLAHLQWWIALLSVSAAGWRLVTEIRQWPFPLRLLRTGIAIAGMAAIFATYKTLNGLEAGTAFLVMLGGMKLLETRTVRDLTITIFVSYFLLFAGILYDQAILRLPYMLLAAWLLTATLMLVHQVSPLSIVESLKRTGKMLLQALPIAVLLFLFFPRLPGQFWAVPSRSDAMTGLSDEMSPGDVSELSISSKLAFRAKFESNKVPPPRDRYWRGPVLHNFDGRTWRRIRGGFVQSPVIATGDHYRYRVTLEPHNRTWIFALDLPTAWPQGTRRTSDYQMLTEGRTISQVTSYVLESSTSFRSNGELPAAMRAVDLALPPGRNPKSIALARTLRDSAADDAAFVQLVLTKLRKEQYFYTLEPPRLESDSVDDILFNTRRGFCEHYASAFVVLARAAGIPARVVTGYQGGEFNPLNNYLLIRQSDAHAWAEVWLEEQGWVRVDPTAAIAPERVEGGRHAALGDVGDGTQAFFADDGALLKLRQVWDAVNTFWNDNIVDFGESQQRSLLERLGLDNPDWRDFGMALLLSFVAFFMALSAWLAWQYRPLARDPVVRVYDALCKQLARGGMPRLPHEGPNDYLARITTRRPELATQIEEIRSLYVGLRYGRSLLGSQLTAQLSRFKFLVNQLRV